MFRNLGGAIDLMVNLLFSHGPLIAYVLIVAILTLAGAGLPMPEEVPVVAAGILASLGKLDPWLAFAACLVGAVLGDSVMYFIGYRFGRGVVREHPWYAHFLTPSREARVEALFHRHGLKLFFFARFLVGLRSPVYLTAGILRVPYRRFLLIDLVSAAVVVGTFFLLSYHYGATIKNMIRGVEWGATAIVIIAASIALFIWWRRRKAALAAATAGGVDQPLPIEPAVPDERATDARASDAPALEAPTIDSQSAPSRPSNAVSMEPATSKTPPCNAISKDTPPIGLPPTNGAAGHAPRDIAAR